MLQRVGVMTRINSQMACLADIPFRRGHTVVEHEEKNKKSDSRSHGCRPASCYLKPPHRPHLGQRLSRHQHGSLDVLQELPSVHAHIGGVHGLAAVW